MVFHSELLRLCDITRVSLCVCVCVSALRSGGRVIGLQLMRETEIPTHLFSFSAWIEPLQPGLKRRSKQYSDAIV